MIYGGCQTRNATNVNLQNVVRQQVEIFTNCQKHVLAASTSSYDHQAKTHIQFAKQKNETSSLDCNNFLPESDPKSALSQRWPTLHKMKHTDRQPRCMPTPSPANHDYDYDYSQLHVCEVLCNATQMQIAGKHNSTQGLLEASTGQAAATHWEGQATAQGCAAEV